MSIEDLCRITSDEKCETMDIVKAKAVSKGLSGYERLY